MESEQFLQLFGGTVGIIIVIVIIIWMILTFFLPFMVYSIMESNKRILEINIKVLKEMQGKGAVNRVKHVEPKI
jgi:branched-subunit amino acid transport protein AzlD